MIRHADSKIGSRTLVPASIRPLFYLRQNGHSDVWTVSRRLFTSFSYQEAKQAAIDAGGGSNPSMKSVDGIEFPEAQRHDQGPNHEGFGQRDDEEQWVHPG